MPSFFIAKIIAPGSFAPQLIRKYYELNHGMSLERAIKKECSGSFETMLLAMIMDPTAYYALQAREYPRQCDQFLGCCF